MAAGAALAGIRAAVRAEVAVVAGAGATDVVDTGWSRGDGGRRRSTPAGAGATEAVDTEADDVAAAAAAPVAQTAVAVDGPATSSLTASQQPSSFRVCAATRRPVRGSSAGGQLTPR